MIYLISLIIPTLAFIFEAYPRILNRKFGVDIWTHLLYLKEYRKQRGIPKNIEEGFLVPGEYDYPPAFIIILSKFPLKTVEKFEFLFSPFFDSIHLLIMFAIVYSLSSNVLLSLLTQAIYILTPIIVLENSSATPRSLGYTLFSIVMFSLFVFSLGGSIIFLLAAIICGSLIFLSHRFTTQGFLFFVIIFSVIEKNPMYILVFIGSLVLALILSGGFYIKVLRGHMGNLMFWYHNIRYRFAHQVKGRYEEHKTDDFIFKVYNQFLKFPPFVLAITNPWTFFVFYVFVLEYTKDPLTQKLILWAVFSYIIALCTIWIERLRFLGEGQRYLELSAFPAAFLSARLLLEFMKTETRYAALPIYITVAFAAFLTIVIIQRKGIIKDTLRSVTPSMMQMFQYLKSLKTKPKLLCIPHQITTNTIYHTGCPVFVNAGYAEINKISEVYPYLKKPVAEIMRKYNLDMILLNENYAKIEDLKLVNYKIVKRIEGFLLIKPS